MRYCLNLERGCHFAMCIVLVFKQGGNCNMPIVEFKTTCKWLLSNDHRFDSKARCHNDMSIVSILKLCGCCDISFVLNILNRVAIIT